MAGGTISPPDAGEFAKWLKLSERPFWQTPIAIIGRLLFGWDGVLGPLACMFDALFVSGVIPQPKLRFVITPTAKEIVEPAAAQVAARQMRRIPQAPLPKFGVKFTIAQMVRVQHIKTAQGQVVQQFPQNGGERFIRYFSGRQQGDVVFGKLSRGRCPILRFHGTEFVQHPDSVSAGAISRSILSSPSGSVSASWAGSSSPG